MSIPLVQGSLRYAYKVAEERGGLREKAEGAVFSAAILPRVAACDPAKAWIISNNMKIDATTHMSAGFTAVKQAFEATYCCLGINCDDIGGLLKSSTVLNDYADCSANSGGANCAAPCSNFVCTTCFTPAMGNVGAFHLNEVLAGLDAKEKQ